MFSANIQQWNTEYFDCRWGVRDFRQGAITIGREFIAPDESYDYADSILAESADHSIAMDHGHYAMVQGVVPRLSNNTICKHRWLGDQWHSVLGLGPLSPPEAIRIRRKNVVNGTNLQSVSDVVRKIMEETLQSFFHSQYAEILKDAVCAGIARQHQYQKDAQLTPDQPSSQAGTFHPKTINLEGNMDDLFYDKYSGQ